MYLCFSVVISYQDYTKMSFYLLKLDEYPILGEWLPIITYYVAVASLVVFFILVLIIIFFPKKISQFMFSKTEGFLCITKKAIEGLVAETLTAEKLMENPKVTAIMTQRKIKIRIKGDFQRVSDLYGKTNEWSEYLENQLHELIGSDVKISITVKFEKTRLENNQRVK